MIKITPNIHIQNWELSETFTKASGPGGQHINKVETAVELRFEAEKSPNLSINIKLRLKKLAGRRWNKEGAIVIIAQEHRLQSKNRALAQKKLIKLIRLATKVPKSRIRTGPTKASEEKRLKSKSQRGRLKILRSDYYEE